MGVLATSAILVAQVAVTTYHNDVNRTGVNPSETILKTSNVNVNTFGKLFSRAVDGQIYSQPLYLPNVLVPSQGTHNVVYVVTEHDSVYAFDADNGAGANAAPLWRVSFLNPAAGVTTVPASDTGCDQIVPELGITSTPVISLADNVIYVVAKTSTNQQLHELDLGTGADVIPASTIGAAPMSFNSDIHLNRPGLLLLNGTVYIGYGSHCDSGGYHGWILGYSATTLQQTAVRCLTPSAIPGPDRRADGKAGIWQAGQGLAGDEHGILTAGQAEQGIDVPEIQVPAPGAGLSPAEAE